MRHGIIYKISCNGAYYIGSTSLSLKKRLDVHKAQSILKPERKLYKKINQNGGFKSCQITKLEEITFENSENMREILNLLEQRHLDKNAGNKLACLNKNKAYVGSYKNYWVSWRENHPEYYRNYSRSKTICEFCGRTVGKSYYSRHKKTRICYHNRKKAFLPKIS